MLDPADINSNNTGFYTVYTRKFICCRQFNILRKESLLKLALVSCLKVVMLMVIKNYLNPHKYFHNLILLYCK